MLNSFNQRLKESRGGKKGFGGGGEGEGIEKRGRLLKESHEPRKNEKRGERRRMERRGERKGKAG